MHYNMKSKISRTITLFIFCVYCMVNAAWATDQHITVNTTWSGTVNQTSNIIIDNGVTLTLLPGTQVAFSASAGIVVNGRLLAVGTATDSIRFTASNTATGWDGIIFDWTPASNDTSKIIYCVLSFGKTTNTAYHSSDGGVIHISHVNKFLITNCRFHHNHADDVAGAIYITNCGGAIRNNIFAYNSSDGAGGICLAASTTIITDNHFYHNSVGFYGGGMIISGCTQYITNCTFSGNTAGLSGGAVMMDSQASVTFTNCIFHNDTGSPGKEISIDNSAYSSYFYYCLVDGGLSGIDGSGKVGAYQNNMDTDPLFAGNGAHPYSLSPSSPCINQGKPDMSGLDVPPADLAGNPRIMDACGNRIDMGAYEYKLLSSFSASGTISSNSFWCADTVNITGNITINNGVTLTIGSNVLVYFRGDWGITVEGTIRAEGTASENIIFKPQNTSSGWSGIVFSGVNNANDTSRFSYCQFLSGIAKNRDGGNNGGAIYIDNYNKVTISACIFQNNNAATEGGAIYLNSANVTVTGCSFSENQSMTGGAISAHNSTLNLTGNRFSYNYATGGACDYTTPSRGGAVYLNTCTFSGTGNTIEHNNTSCQGGGLYATASTLTLTNDTLSYNSAEDYSNSGSGGGLFCSSSALTATGNQITNNTGTWGGGAFLGGVSGEIHSNTFSRNLAYVSGITQSQGGGIVFANGANPVFRNNVVKNNSATYSGGIDINGSNPQIIQNLVISNQATTGGGGIGFSNASPTILNNTICNNVGENYAGGLWISSSSSPVVRNNIIYGNSSVNGGGYQVYLVNNSCNPDFYFCNIQGGRSGFGGNSTNYTGDYENNMDGDPLFVNSGVSPYQIEPASPCMNMGDPATTTSQTGDHDLAGNPRIRNGRIDIGAYETVREAQPFAGTAIQFSGANDSIVLDNQSHFIFGNKFSIEFWLKAGPMSTGYHTILKKGTEWEIRLFYDEELSILEFGINDNSVFSYYQTTGTFLVNHWNHIAAVYNLSSPVPYLAIYVNGVEGITDDAETITHLTVPVTIGAGIIGLMDELRVWQTARTLEEIRTSMHLMIPPESSGLMTYHQFNGYFDSTVVDISGGNNGTLMNMNLPGCLVESTVPAAGGASHLKIISSTGKVDFTGTDLTMDIKSLGSTDTVVVSRLDTLPNLNPPGANYVQPQYWITDVYGGGNLTADLTFHVLQDITIDDEVYLDLNRMYSRGQNSDSLWIFVKNSYSASTLDNTVTFNNITHSGQFCVPHRVVPDDIAGKALEFNGVNQYVKIDPLYTESPGAITAETWFFPTAPAPGNEMILYNGEYGEFYLMYHQNTFTFAVKLNNQNWYTVTGPAPALKTWYHVCGVWQNNGSLKIYVNGILCQTGSIPALNLYDPGSSYLASIGCYNRNAGVVAGKADELRVWNVARTTQQIREYMHLTIPDETTGMLGYWQFNENSGSETKDHAGNHDGLLVNMSDTCRVLSSIPAGGGSSCTKIINAPGTEEFTGTGIRMNFIEKSGADTIVVTQIDTSANVNPLVDTLYAEEFWVIHQYGNGTLNAKIRFDVGGDVTHWDEAHPAGIALFSRPYNSEDGWELCRKADSAWRSGNRVQFSGITSLGQFSIGKGIHPVIGVSPDSVRFVRSPSTVTIADSVLISNKGTDTLKITGITHSNPQFTLEQTQMNISLGQEQYLVVYYRPTADGNAFDTLHIASNDPLTPVTTVRIKGQGFVIDRYPGTALQYNGTSQYVQVSDNNSLDLTNNYTFEAWICPQAFNWLGGIISKYQTSGADGYYLRLTGSQPYSGLNFDGVSTANGILALNQWYHVAAVNDNGARRIYLNGVSLLVTGTPDIIKANSDILAIGMDYGPQARFFKGKIDEVRIWNVARTEQQIRENMHLTLKGNEPGLVSYYQFNEGTGSSSADKIHLNNGTLNNFSGSGWLPSTIAAGGGSSNTQTVSAPGQVNFFGTGVSMDFRLKSGSDQIVVTKIDSTANINPNGSSLTFARQYWAIHQYGSGTFTSDITFALQEEMGQGDQHNPTRIMLDSRGCMADTSWGFLAPAANVDAASHQVTFRGISGSGQFITGRGKIIYVKSDATGTNNGSSWGNAFTSLKSSLDEAVAGNQIWVAAGKYLPESAYNIPAATNRHKHFRMKNNLGIFGGFAGMEADSFDLSERDLVTHETVLSGDLNNNGTDHNDCYHLFYHPAGLGLTNTAILDGFSVMGGNTDGDDPFVSGGGMYNISNSPMIRNCIFKENNAKHGGGLGNASSSSPQFVNCLIVNNTAAFSGGGIINSSASGPVFINCTLAGNSASAGGGILNSDNSDPVFDNCIIWGNRATGNGNPGNQLYIDQGAVTLNYSCYSDTTGDVYLTNGGTLIAGNNNITVSPLFIYAANGDFRIFGDSPCVNTGDNGFNTESMDVRGETRIRDGIIDRGAYEWTSGVDPALHLFTWTGAVSTDWNTPGNWTSDAVPGPSDDVYIPDVVNDPVVNQSLSAPAACNNLTINKTTVLTILQYKGLVVYGNLVITP